MIIYQDIAGRRLIATVIEEPRMPEGEYIQLPNDKSFGPAEALRMITMLRARGFTVEITGTADCWATIRTDNSDLTWEAFAKTTEEAVLMAARHVFVYLSDTRADLLSVLPE